MIIIVCFLIHIIQLQLRYSNNKLSSQRRKRGKKAMDNTEYKFGKMLSAASQLSADDAGTLDVSTGDKVIFNPN